VLPRGMPDGSSGWAARPLDFANTVTWTGSGLENERLGSYADLLDWARDGGLIPRGGRPAPAADAVGAADAALERARERRRLLHAAFVAARPALLCRRTRPARPTPR
jgi:hypothetical protein